MHPFVDFPGGDVHHLALQNLPAMTARKRNVYQRILSSKSDS